ncbi:MAG: nucleotidyltransferase family protein [Armatimonadota bacterium]
MTPIVQEHLEELKALCRKYHVAELYLFGSAANGEFKEESSDLDFLVNFQPMDPFTYADAFLDFADDLEQLFNRPVDLVIERAIRNPYFKEEVDETKVKLFAA